MVTAWVLNLDAEDELAARGAYTPSARSLAVMAEQSAMAERAVCAPGDVLVEPGKKLEGGLRELRAAAWCPTPRALDALRTAGLEPEPAPSVEVLRRVNSRAFSAALGQTLPGATFAVSETEALAAITGGGPFEGAVLLKRAFGYAGRGRRTILGDAPSETDVAWIRASFRQGHGLQVEPFVRIETEFAAHGTVDGAGTFAFRGVVVQASDARGTWLSARPPYPHELKPEERSALEGEAARVARALATAGYFGPFGVDAYRYEGPHGELLWNPRSEINARYTMGWAASGWAAPG